MEIVVSPHVEERADVDYVGIRVITPFRGMMAMRDSLLAELREWVREHGDPPAHYFLRLHVIDMQGPMDLELGAIVEETVPESDRVKRAVLPAGKYATMTYVNHAMRANRMLLEWIAEQGLPIAKTVEQEGDHFACRYEQYPSNLFEIRKKTTWPVLISIKLG